MHSFRLALCVQAALCLVLNSLLFAQQDDQETLSRYRSAGLAGGDAGRGKAVFESKQAGCRKCHAFGTAERLAGPDLSVVGNKFRRPQLVQAVLEPSASLHPDFGALVVRTKDGKTLTGVLRKRTEADLQMFDAEGTLVRVPLDAIEEEHRSPTSLMPAGLQKNLTTGQFADLIAYLESLRQAENSVRTPGMPTVILPVENPVRLVPLHAPEDRFEFPVWIMAIPGRAREYLVVEQKSCKVWRFSERPDGPRKELFVDLSSESTTGEFEGVVCLAFHPRFTDNRRYFVKYHLRNQGSHFSPVIVERQATPDLSRDAGVPSRKVLQIHQATDLHWGGMIAFGPDGWLYIGAGDAGPQEDPEGHGQDLSTWNGKILRIDVDQAATGKSYGIPQSNPFSSAPAPVRPEIWAYGYRNPWRFSFDSETGDLWVGDIGQNLFEEVSIARSGENHGWNVYEGFEPFSEQFRRSEEKYVAPIFGYRREHGVSVTGGYVYRGRRSPSYVGAYICGDFESKRLWALTQSDRRLVRVRQIGDCAQRIASFGVDHAGELLVVGYEGTLYRLDLSESDFHSTPLQTVRVRLTDGEKPAAARVLVLGLDDQPAAPAGSVVRKNSAGESYFYADGEFSVQVPRGEARLSFSGGLETIPVAVHLDATGTTDLPIRLDRWINLAERGWYAGDSHIHLHTGGPFEVSVQDALVAARAEGIHFANLCVSNVEGDDIRDAGLITGRPHAASTGSHLLVFGEEMRSMIYGHMQFFGIQKLVEPQYTGFDNTPQFLDFPSNYQMAAEAVRQGGVVTYGHPLFQGQPFPFEDDLSKPNGAARELPVDAILGVVQAVDVMSYNSDEPLSAELWYRLLNCGLRLAACVGTDALLDRSTDPLGGDRMYVKVEGPFSMPAWLDGLRRGRTFVTNGPVPMLRVEDTEPGDTLALHEPKRVRVSATVEGLVPFASVELIMNGEVAAQRAAHWGAESTLKTSRFEFDLAVERSSWVALRVRGQNAANVFDGPVWAHTSPVYVTVADRPIESPADAQYFVEWIDKLIQVLSARNRFARPEDRKQIEELFRKAQNEYRKQIPGGAP